MCLERLDPADIPQSERLEDQPAELVAVLGRRAWRHAEGPVGHVAFHRDGGRVASVGPDGLRVWDRHADGGLGRELYTLPEFRLPAAFSADWTVVVGMAAGDKPSGDLRVWNLSEGPHPVFSEPGEPLEEISSRSGGTARPRVTATAVAEDGRLIAGGYSDGTIQLWASVEGEMVRGPCLRPADRRVGVSNLAFSPDGSVLAVVTVEGDIRLWEMTGPLPRSGPDLSRVLDWGTGLAFSPDGRVLAASGSEDVLMLGLNGPRVEAEWWTNIGAADGVAFSPDGRRLAVSSFGSFGVYDITGPVPVLEEQLGQSQDTGNYGYQLPVAFSPNGRTLAGGGPDARVTLWRLRSIEPGAVAVSDDGAVDLDELLIDDEVMGLDDVTDDESSGPESGRATVANPPSGLSLPAGWLAFFPDGCSLATAGGDWFGADRRVADRPTEIWSLAPGGGGSAPPAIDGRGPLTLSRDGSLILNRDRRGRGVIWRNDGGSWALGNRIVGPNRVPPLDDGVVPIRLSPESPCGVTPDGLLLGNQTVFTVWGLGGLAPGAARGPRLEGPIMAASPAGDLVATVRPAAPERPSRAVAIWAIVGGEARLVREVTTAAAPVAISADGRLLVTATRSGRVAVWRTDAEHTRRGPSWQFPSRVLGAAFTHDGRHLALGNANGTVYILRLPDESLRSDVVGTSPVPG